MSDASGGGSTPESGIQAEQRQRALDEQLRTAVAHHEVGQLREAQSLYESVLEQDPEHVHALHLLGLLAHQVGRNEDARKFIGDAIFREPNHAYMHNNLGEVLRVLGDLEGASDRYREALRLDPNYGQAHNNLAIVLHERGDLSGAERALEDAVRVDGSVAEVHNNLGVAKQALGKQAEAVSCFKRSRELNPHHVEALNNLGAALLVTGELDEAKRVLDEAIAVDAHCAKAYFNLGKVLGARGDNVAAEQAARQAVELDHSEPEFHVSLGNVLRDAGKLEQAIDALRAALSHHGSHAIILNDLGVCLLVQGRFDEAWTFFRRALKSDPGLAVAHENISKTKRFGEEDAQNIANLEALADGPGQPEDAQIHLHFAVGKMLDDTGHFDRAWAHIRKANALKRRSVDFDADACHERIERTCATMGTAFISDRRHFGNESEAPVFIVGMPRSGTSLAEQILATHPNVYGGGEREFFRQLAPRLSAHLKDSRGYPECLAALDEHGAQDIAGAYLEQLQAEAGGALRVTDKMPLNFEHLGLIALVFPKACIIHCRRDPLDTCLSIYFQHFTTENEYAYSMADIAAYYREYDRLMAHWNVVLAGRIHELVYEDVVSDLDGQSRALVEHVGLPWDDRCLRFHETDRPVGTSSHWQVRQPLYTSSVGRWKHYEAELGELKALLAPLA